MSLWPVAVWLALAAAGPEPLALPGFRLHLELSENIEPDRLESLARPGVVLWLETTSNLLKRSLAERLGRADASYVEVRPPFGSVNAWQQFTGHTHPWVALAGFDVATYRRWAPAGSAAELVGSLTEERLTQLRGLRAQAVRWQPLESPTPEEWARTLHVPGLEVRPPAALPPCERPLKGAARIRLRVPWADAEASGAGCGFALRLEIPLSSTEAELRELLVKWPGAELWARISSEADGALAGGLVKILAQASPATRGAARSEAH